MASILANQTTIKKTSKEDKSNISLGWKMIFIAVFLGIISLYMNVSFGYSLGTDSASKFTMAGQYLSFDLAKLISLLIIGYALTKKQHVHAVVFSIVFVLTVGFSLISAQAYMASLLHGQKVERLKGSDAYQDNKNAKQRASSKVESLAISSSEVGTAQGKIERLERQASAARSTYENYANRGNYPTRANQAANELDSIEAQLEKQQSIVNQGNAYRGALTNLARLEGKQVSGGFESVENAGLSSVAFALGLDVKTFQARLLLFMAIGSELITTMFFFYSGHVLGSRVRKYTHNEMIQMQHQLMEETKEKEAMNDQFKSFLPVVETLAEAQSTEEKIDPEDID
ncbi:MAG: hypothetical protein Q9M28_12160 [Mariprofundaceae bacterium]|nr:hypothetical protein [Mariprofundaceae bacterium]